MLLPTRSILSSFLTAALVVPAASGFDAPLSDTTVRQAYFLGQRRDNSVALFLEKYRRRLSAPKTGPHISMVELFTPYAETVELCATRSGNFSAQQAEQEYRKRDSRVRLSVQILFTPGYGPQYQRAYVPDRNSPALPPAFPSDFWKSFSVRLQQDGKAIQPLDLRGQNTYIALQRGGSIWTGALLILTFDPEAISPAGATVEVASPDGQHVVATFDLASLR